MITDTRIPMQPIPPNSQIKKPIYARLRKYKEPTHTLQFITNILKLIHFRKTEEVNVFQ